MLLTDEQVEAFLDEKFGPDEEIEGGTVLKVRDKRSSKANRQYLRAIEQLVIKSLSDAGRLTVEDS